MGENIWHTMKTVFFFCDVTQAAITSFALNSDILFLAMWMHDITLKDYTDLGKTNKKKYSGWEILQNPILNRCSTKSNYDTSLEWQIQTPEGAPFFPLTQWLWIQEFLLTQMHLQIFFFSQWCTQHLNEHFEWESNSILLFADELTARMDQSGL